MGLVALRPPWDHADQRRNSQGTPFRDRAGQGGPWAVGQWGLLGTICSQGPRGRCTLTCKGFCSVFQRNSSIPNGKLPMESPMHNFTIKEKGTDGSHGRNACQQDLGDVRRGPGRVQRAVLGGRSFTQHPGPSSAGCYPACKSGSNDKSQGTLGALGHLCFQPVSLVLPFLCHQIWNFQTRKRLPTTMLRR